MELLLVGQVDDAASPSAAAAEVYVLSEGYGTPVGLATPGLVETPDIAPAGALARIKGRQVTTVIGHQAACTIRLTPIIDLNEELDPIEVAFPARTKYMREPVLCRFVRMLTYARVRVEVLDCDGPVEVFTPILGAEVDHLASVNAAGAVE
jgi:hypothetical protein